MKGQLRIGSVENPVGKYLPKDGWVVIFSAHEKIPEREKLMFLLIHKNASTSLRKSHDQPEKLEKYYSVEEFNNSEYTKVVILRDPWDRFISAIRQVYKLGISRKTIEGMISYLESHPEEEINTHLVSQSWFLKDRKIDYYLKLENIQEDWKVLEKKFNLNPLPLYRVTEAQKRRNIEVLFDKDLKERALKYLERDYELISKVFQ